MLACLYSPSSVARDAPQSLVTLANVSGPISLNADVSYYKDDSGQASVETVLALASAEWQQGTQKTPSFGYSSAAYWFRVALFSPHEGGAQRLLEVNYPLLDQLTLYRYVDGQVTQLDTLGDVQPFYQRPIHHRNFVFPIEIPPATALTLYLRVETTSSVQVPMVLWQPQGFYENAIEESSIQGVFFGIMLVMALYNAFVFLVVRDISYLFYVFYVVSFSILQGALQGFTYQYLWPESMWWNDKSIAFLIPCTLLFVILFTRVFLGISNTGKNRFSDRRHDIATKCLVCINAAIACGAFLFPYALMIKLSIVTALFNCIGILYVGFDSLRNGNRAARYFCLAWVSLLVSVIIYGFNKFGLIPRSFFTENFMQIGSATEVILLSFALADRFNKERQEKYEAKQLALSHALRAKEEHERSVSMQKASHEKEMQAVRMAAKSEAENKAKTQFLATMSHEIRTPMNGVIGMTELMMDTPLNAQQQSYIDVIKNSGQSLLTIINDILDYAKIAAGEMELEKINIDLGILVEDCVAMFRPIAEKKKIEIGVIYTLDNGSKIVADPTRLRQIITNLISNALKFTEEGFVCIEVTEVGVDTDSPTIRIEVHDTGIGISDENQKRLFFAFKQADTSTTRRFGGTGLGLSICKQLVELMGGTIGVLSVEGKGSVFWMEVVRTVPDTQDAVGLLPDDAPLESPTHPCLVCTTKPLVQRLIEHACVRWPSMSLDIVREVQGLHQWIENNDDPNAVIVVDSDWTSDALQTIHGLQQTHEFRLNIGLMVRMGFDIPVARREETGCRFLLQKPISANEFIYHWWQISDQDDARQAKKTNQPQFHDYSHFRVLVAEDNPVNQMVIMGMLRKFNIVSDIAENGQLAVDRFRTDSYDLILMDCEMPVMDGLEATREIRRIESTQTGVRIPIVALTAHAMKEYKERFIEAGMDAFLVKPITFDRLSAVLNNVSQGRLLQTG